MQHFVTQALIGRGAAKAVAVQAAVQRYHATVMSTVADDLAAAQAVGAKALAALEARIASLESK